MRREGNGIVLLPEHIPFIVCLFVQRVFKVLWHSGSSFPPSLSPYPSPLPLFGDAFVVVVPCSLVDREMVWYPSGCHERLFIFSCTPPRNRVVTLFFFTTCPYHHPLHHDTLGKHLPSPLPGTEKGGRARRRTMMCTSGFECL